MDRHSEELQRGYKEHDRLKKKRDALQNKDPKYLRKKCRELQKDLAKQTESSDEWQNRFMDLEPLVNDVALLTDLLIDVEIQIECGLGDKASMVASILEKKTEELYKLYYSK